MTSQMMFALLAFILVVCTNGKESCNETEPPIVLTQCCRDGRDGRNGITIMGPRGPTGCKGDNGKDGKEGKEGPEGPPGKCNDTELIIVKEELENKRLLNGNLVGHWKMDEETIDNVDDDSGHGCHGVVGANKPKVSRGKYSRGRRFNPNDFINVDNCPSMKFGKGSFTFSGWLKIEDYTYPLTNFAVLQGQGCYFKPGRPGFTAGWDIGHGFQKGRTEVCIRDDKNNVGRAYIKHDIESDTSLLQGKWTQYVVVFDRSNGKIQFYINGKKQKAELDITNVTGSIDNDKPLVFGRLYGWQTKGTIDEYRLYKGALTPKQVSMIYNNKNL